MLLDELALPLELFLYLAFLSSPRRWVAARLPYFSTMYQHCYNIECHKNVYKVHTNWRGVVLMFTLDPHLSVSLTKLCRATVSCTLHVHHGNVNGAQLLQNCVAASSGRRPKAARVHCAYSYGAFRSVQIMRPSRFSTSLSPSSEQATATGEAEAAPIHEPGLSKSPFAT